MAPYSLSTLTFNIINSKVVAMQTHTHFSFCLIISMKRCHQTRPPNDELFRSDGSEFIG